MAALASKIGNLEAEPGPRRARRIQQARMLVTKCAVSVDIFQIHLPLEVELYRLAKQLLVFMMGELDRLLLDKGVLITRAPRWLN